jgi:hypothetical protein
MILRMKHRKASCRRIRLTELRAFVYSLVRQTFTHYALDYWAYLMRGLMRRPLMAAEIVALAVKGHHFFTITEGLLSLERFKEWLEELRRNLETRLKDTVRGDHLELLKLETYRGRLLKQAWNRCRRVHPDLRDSATRVYEEFRAGTERLLIQGSRWREIAHPTSQGHPSPR